MQKEKHKLKAILDVTKWNLTLTETRPTIKAVHVALSEINSKRNVSRKEKQSELAS